MRGAWLPALLAAVKSWMRRLAGTRRATTLSHHPWLHPLTVAKRAQVPKWLRGERSRSVNPMLKHTLKEQLTQHIQLHLFTTQWELWHFSNCWGGSQKAMISANGSRSWSDVSPWHFRVWVMWRVTRNLRKNQNVSFGPTVNLFVILFGIAWVVYLGCAEEITATVALHQRKTIPNSKLQTSCCKDRFMGVTLMKELPFGGQAKRTTCEWSPPSVWPERFLVSCWEKFFSP